MQTLWNIKRAIGITCLLGISQIMVGHAQDTMKKIVVFKDATSAVAIDHAIADWENAGWSVLMPLPFINGIALQIPDDVAPADLLLNPIIDIIENDQPLDLLTLRGAGEGGAGEGGAGEGGAGEEPPASAVASYDKPARLGDRPWGVLNLYDSFYDPTQYMDYEAILTVPALIRTTQINVGRIKIAVFDTGIDFYHNRLNHLVKDGIDLVDFRPGLPMDENGHGTHIAGTLAAWEFGVAPEAELYAVKILDEHAAGDLSTLVMGLQWALDHDIDVVNMSIGFRSDHPLVRKAVESAHDAGLIMVAAVGNHSNWEGDDVASGEGGAGEGGAGEGDSKAPYSVMYPAAYPQVIAVGAIDSYQELAGFSNTGSETDVLAPGVNVVSTYLHDGFGIANGTSMATPHVTGAVALMLALAEVEGVDLTPDQVRTILRDTALDGIIDLNAALNQVHAESLAGGLVNTTTTTLTNTIGEVSGLLRQ